MKQVLIIDCGSTKVPAIEKNLMQLGVSYDTVKLLNLTGVNEYEALIISGAPILLTEVPHTLYLEKAKIIFENSQLPVLGICFGHQLMGIYHDAKIMRCPEDRSLQHIKVHADSILLEPGTTSTLQMEDHCEAITLPVGFKHIGSSVTCRNEIMQHEKNPWYGVQFHPEVSEAAGHEIIANFIHYALKKQRP